MSCSPHQGGQLFLVKFHSSLLAGGDEVDVNSAISSNEEHLLNII